MLPPPGKPETRVWDLGRGFGVRMWFAVSSFGLTEHLTLQQVSSSGTTPRHPLLPRSSQEPLNSGHSVQTRGIPAAAFWEVFLIFDKPSVVPMLCWTHPAAPGWLLHSQGSDQSVESVCQSRGC